MRNKLDPWLYNAKWRRYLKHRKPNISEDHFPKAVSIVQVLQGWISHVQSEQGPQWRFQIGGRGRLRLCPVQDVDLVGASHLWFRAGSVIGRT